MSYGYTLSLGQARICRIAAFTFLAAGLIRAAVVLAPFTIASAHGLDVKCMNGSCYVAERPDLLLPEEERAAVTASREATARLAAYTARPEIRAGLTAIDIVESSPFIALMLCVAAAVWRLGARQDDDLDRALPWLRRASIGALGVAVVLPFTQSIRAMMLFPATPSGPSWYFAIDFGPFLVGVLLAFAAFIVTWAIAAGSRARRDVAEFV